MVVFISDAEGCGSFGFAMARLCWRTSTALAADSPPLLCPGPLALLIQHQDDQHTGTVPRRERGHSETPLFSLRSLLWNTFAGRSIPTASPGASSFTTALWLHRSGQSVGRWHEHSRRQTQSPSAESGKKHPMPWDQPAAHTRTYTDFTPGTTLSVTGRGNQPFCP